MPWGQIVEHGHITPRELPSAKALIRLLGRDNCSISMKGADRKMVVYHVEDTALCHPADQFTIGKHIVLYYTFCPKSVPSRALVRGDKTGRNGNLDAQLVQSGTKAVLCDRSTLFAVSLFTVHAIIRVLVGVIIVTHPQGIGAVVRVESSAVIYAVLWAEK